MAILEIGWNSIHESRLVHENKSYLGKKEVKITQIIKQAFSQTYMKLRLITGAVK